MGWKFSEGRLYLVKRGGWRLGRRGLGVEGMVVSSGLGRSGGSGCLLGCPSVFSSSFVLSGRGFLLAEYVIA